MDKLIPVIMAGGSGTRLWPLSRQLKPKQFISLCEQQTMMQVTLRRLEGIDHAPPYLICNEQHRFLAAEQLRQLGICDASILLEPVAKNTAPAIALAALQATESGDDPLLLVLAADHLIEDENAFHDAICEAKKVAEDDYLVTFGIVPTQAETGYGYIQRGKKLSAEAYTVQRFIEKPDRRTAESYIASGEYCWNSGMFLFRASRYLSELKCHAPEVLDVCKKALLAATTDLDFTRFDPAIFEQCPDVSIDYAVMEKTERASIVSLDAGWNDIGSWSSLLDISDKDTKGNALQGDVLIDSVENTLVRADHRLVTAIGVKDLVIVETKDALLVAHKDKVQNVKKIVAQIKDQGRSEHINHREVYRPWGVYDSIGCGDRYQVKKITVNPGAKLSLQMHYHRAEHWVVVSGTAKVTIGDKIQLVTENQSTYIPIGQIHSLENAGRIPLELIEVQSGSYLGEDDIVRFEDQYGRC